MKKLWRRALTALCAVCMGVLTGFAMTACKGELLPDAPPAPEAGTGDEHVHSYGTAWTQDENYHWHACEGEDCEEVSDKAEHGWNAGEKLSDSTCTTRGETRYTCTECAAQKSEYAPFVHNYEPASVIAPTCSNTGYTVMRCTICKDEVRTDPQPETGHDYEKTVVSATCLTDETTTYDCKNCNDTYTEITQRAPGHDTENATWVIAGETLVQDSVCTYHVTEETTCTRSGCGATVTRDVEELIHKGAFTSTITQTATCTSEGTIEYVCACGEDEYSYETHYENNEAHNWNAGVANGNVTTYTCAYDQNHTKQTVEATRSEDGNSSTISADALSAVSGDTGVELAVTDNTTMQMDSSVLNAVKSASTSGDVMFVAEELGVDDLPDGTTISTDRVGDTIYNFGLTADGHAVDFNGGKMIVTVPYELQEGDDPNALTILWLKDNGEVEAIAAVYDAATGTITVTLEHFSYYTVVRMTGAEICARDKAHKEKVMVVPKTCTQDGYTLTICSRCNESWRTNVQKAEGHHYVQTVIAPTCTERGYTRYVCQNAGCNDSYVMNYTAQIAHNYVDTVVAPTCTEKGHTAHSCSACGKTYRDTYVVPNGHTYSSGNCKICGEKDLTYLANANNFYFNLINSVSNANGYYIEVNDIEMNATVESEEFDAEVSYSIDMYRFTFRVDDDGYIVGQGEGKVSMVMLENEDGHSYNERMNMDMIVVFQNGKVYMFQKLAETVDLTTTVQNLYVMEEQAGMDLDELKDTYEAFGDNLTNIFDGIIGKENNPLNTAMANVVDYLFEKTETADGFTYVLNYEKLPEVYAMLTEDTVAVAFDKVFGEGEFAKISEYVLAVPDKTVTEIKTDIVNWCLDYGVQITDVYAVIDQFVSEMYGTPEGEEPFSVSKLLTDYGDKTIAQVIDMMMEMPEGETGRDDYVEKIQGTLDMLSESSIADLAMMAGMSGGNSQESTPPSGETKPLPMSGSVDDGEDGDDEADEEEDQTTSEQMTAAFMAYLKEEISSLVESLTGTSSMGFTTDKSGNLMTVSAAFDGFKHSLTVDAALFGEEGEIAVSVELDGTVTVVVDGDYIADYDEIVTALEKSKKVFDIQDEIDLIQRDSYPDDDGDTFYVTYKYTLYPTEKGALLMSKYDEYSYNYSQPQNYKEDTYNGVSCYSYEIYTYGNSAKLLVPEKGVQFSDSCHGWKQYTANAYYLGESYYKVYVREDGAKLAVVPMYEKMFERLENGSYNDYTRVSLYYNAGLNEYTMTEPHNYVVTARDIPDECEEQGYILYRCTICAQEKRESLYKGHEGGYSYELADGAQSCEDGLLSVWRCKECGTLISSYEVSAEEAARHPTYRVTEVLPGATANTCPEHYIGYYVCACGENKNGFSVYSGNGGSFGWVDEYFINDGKEEHYCSVYRCSVTDNRGKIKCGYTYVTERYVVRSTATCTETWTYKYYLGVSNLPEEPTAAPTTYAGTYSYTVVNPWHESDEENDYTWNGNVCTHRLVCINCKQTIHECRTEYFGYVAQGDYYRASRELYWFDYENGYGYEYTYDNCNRTAYSLRMENGEIVASDGRNEGVYHSCWEEMLYRATCTQFGWERKVCLACGNYERSYRTAPDSHYYWWDSDAQTYVCGDCGMANSSSADGAFELEDMTANGTIKLGYFNKFNRKYDIRVFVNYNTNDPIDLLTYCSLEEIAIHNKNERSREEAELDNRWYWGLECGMITFDMQALWSVLDSLDGDPTIEMLTVVFSTEYNYETEYGAYQNALEYGINFELGKSGAYTLSRFCDDGMTYAVGDSYGETVLAADTVTLTLNADFTFSAFIDGDVTYGDDIAISGDWKARGDCVMLYYVDVDGDECAWRVLLDGSSAYMEEGGGYYDQGDSSYYVLTK